jgi:uncharacterized membrane protein (DUF2068 family)
MSNAPQHSSHLVAETSSRTADAGGPHDRGLLTIAIFKLAKSAFFFCIGVGAIHFLHKDLRDPVLWLAHALRFDPESRAVSLVLDKVDLIGAPRLREIGIATFAYSALALTEGIGLLLERTWAEYLTLILTISLGAVRVDRAPQLHSRSDLRPQPRGALVSDLAAAAQRDLRAGMASLLKRKRDSAGFERYSLFIHVRWRWLRARAEVLRIPEAIFRKHYRLCVYRFAPPLVRFSTLNGINFTENANLVLYRMGRAIKHGGVKWSKVERKG